ncbi:MAG: hypothetical protein H0T60_02315 [Acidobacteria bacterium]|nr:hypothetical protein [Acidobacteriota bacterium]
MNEIGETTLRAAVEVLNRVKHKGCDDWILSKDYDEGMVGEPFVFNPSRAAHAMYFQPFEAVAIAAFYQTGQPAWRRREIGLPKTLTLTTRYTPGITAEVAQSLMQYLQRHIRGAQFRRENGELYVTAPHSVAHRAEVAASAYLSGFSDGGRHEHTLEERPR